MMAAPFTALRADGEINLDAVEDQAAMLRRNGVCGVFVCGTTGEGLSLTTDERMQVAQRWMEVAGRKMRVFVHVSHTSVVEARALAAHARKIGAHAVGMMGPVFFRSSRVEDVAAHCAIVAEAAGELPFYYYHIPSYNGAYVSVCRLLEAAKDRIANLAGAKFTHEDLADYGACLALEGGRFDILFGRDEMLLAALALGAKGAIGSTYNFAGLLYGGLLEAFDGGDLVRARRLQAKAVEIIDAISATACGYLPAAKAIVKMLGLDLGPVRSPLRDITVEEEKALRARLERIGFFEYACKL